MQSINVVWLKRDLRLQDHAPLQEALKTGKPTLLLYVFEQSLMQAKDYDVRHARFIWQSLQDMQKQLGNQTKILIVRGEMLEIFAAIQQQNLQIKHLFSHQETGNAISFERDKNVIKFCRERNIAFKEWSDRGIVRGLKVRNNWPKQWYGYMEEAVISNELNKVIWAEPPLLENVIHQFSDLFPTAKEQEPLMQPGGTTNGLKYLHSFLANRGLNYQKHISKPELARTACGRLSPYLAFGCLSMRQVYQATKARIAGAPFMKRPLDFFLDRLRWHSHFVQKFESASHLEFANTNSGYNHLRNETNENLVQAWKNGQTGYPLVDACMRCVQQTGYLNFRMRAMVVSFLTHHLWQPWQAGVHYLGKQFLDYEPGIHYSQFHMQSGVTGINTIRIYNPVKQSQDHDAEGTFIKKWVPELAAIPVPLIHTPWLLTTMEQQQTGCVIGKDYPAPIVNLEAASKHARDQLWGTKKSATVKKQNLKILGHLTDRTDEEASGA